MVSIEHFRLYYYLRLLASLGDKSLGFAVRSLLTPQQMTEYDHEALGDAMVRRLSELYVEERHRAHINARGCLLYTSPSPRDS